jgi:RNA polymerase sigma-70 factor (ECF subfamily)
MSDESTRGTHPSLIDRLRRSDSTGWKQLSELYRPLICYWARRFGVASPDDEDIAQEVFVVVTKKIDSFRLGERPGSFRKWLKTITWHVCQDRFRRDGQAPRAVGGTDAALRLNEVTGPADDEEDPPELVADLLHEVIKLVHTEFSEDHWRVFESLTVEGLGTAEVAERLGLTKENVRTIKSRIYRRVNEELGEVSDDTPPDPKG